MTPRHGRIVAAGYLLGVAAGFAAANESWWALAPASTATALVWVVSR